MDTCLYIVNYKGRDMFRAEVERLGIITEVVTSHRIEPLALALHGKLSELTQKYPDERISISFAPPGSLCCLKESPLLSSRMIVVSCRPLIVPDQARFSDIFQKTPEELQEFKKSIAA